MQINFGAGLVWMERVDVTGSGIGPRALLALQNFQLDFDWTMKELKAQYQMPIAIARSDQKVTGKLTFAAFQARLLSDIMFGVTPAAGQLAAAYAEAGTIPGSPTYIITVANAANYSDDLGVLDAATGIPFNRVTSPSATGQYSVNLGTGVYTFSSADAGKAVVLGYLWNNSAAGSKLAIVNQLSGVTPMFKLTHVNPISPGPPGGGGQSLPFGVHFNACTASKFSLPFKMDDWTMQELDFEVMADAAGNVGYISSGQ